MTRTHTFDRANFATETRKRGYRTTDQIADAARISARTVRRAVTGEELPSPRLLLWMAEVGIDVRKVWVCK